MISTWSAKIGDEQKEKLQNLIDRSGLSSKDFLENMITFYELNESKVRVKEISEDISEVQQLTLRMNNIFINLKNMYDKDVNRYTEVNHNNQQLIAEYNEKLKDIENENVNLVEQVKTLENELNNKTIFINDLQRSFDDLQRKIEGDKEKLELEAEKKLVKAEKIYNDSLQKIQEEYNKKLFEFLSEFNEQKKDKYIDEK